MTPALIRRAFERVPLPTSRLDISPPGGQTLVNLRTITSTEADRFTRSLTLLGRRVTLDIRPTAFHWHYGDGTTRDTSTPGRPYTRGVPMYRYLTHTYRQAGRVTASVTVEWGARYRLGNGPWAPVDGTVSIDGPGYPLRIREATPRLVG